MSDSTSRTEKWFVDFLQKAHVPRHTAYEWWHAFCAETEQSWILIFGAHRLAVHVLLERETIEARILEPGLSEEEYLLIELQENSARNDLTKGQRKAYAAEVGQLLEKITANGNTGHWFRFV
jgi:hypothetical protein